MRRVLPAVAVGVTLLAVWPWSQSAFHEPKKWLFVAAALLAAVITLPRWRWTALPLLALTVVQPWRSQEAGLQAFAFAWALAAWPALQPELRQLTRIAGIAAAGVGLVVILQALGLDVLAFAEPAAGESRLRLYGTLGNPDFVASGLLPIAVLLLGPGLPARGRIVALVLIIPALVMTRSFATLLGAFVAGVVLTYRSHALSPTLAPKSGAGPAERWASAAEAKRKMRRGEATQEAGRGSYVVLLCGLLALGLVGRDLGTTLAGRRYLVSVALPHVADAPLLGHGLGATVQAWPEWELSYWQARCADAACVAAHPDRKFAALQDHVHADWLEWLLERGLVGALALALALGAPLLTLWRSRDELSSFHLAALGAVLARSLVDFPLHRPADLCLLAALAACVQVSPPPSPASSPS